MNIQSLLENDVVRLLFGLCIQIFLSYPIRFIANRTMRYTYSLIIGSLLQFLVFGLPILTIHAFGLLIYAVVQLQPQRCGALATLLAMLFLSWYHFNAIVYRYGQDTMDQIVLLMMLVCKYSLFAYAYQDGHTQKTEQVSADSKERLQNNIGEEVSILDFFGYIQFVPTCLMGPPIEYRLYRSFMELENLYRNIPSLSKPLLKTAKEFLFCSFFYAISMFVIPCSYMKSEEFWARNPLQMFLYSALAITLFRFKFYSAWNVSMASIHSCGISYQGAQNFNAITLCQPLIIETTPHVREKANNWNMMVQEWLRKCIYNRLPFKSKMASQLSVFMVSAFWHGFYAGYYLSFFFWFTEIYLQGQIFKYCKREGNILTKIYEKLGKAGPILTVVTCNLIFAHCGSFFYLLESELCFKLIREMYCIPQIIPIVGIIVFTVLAGGNKKERTK